MADFPQVTQYVRLDEEKNLLPFDCGDSDLNDFFLSACKDYLSKLLAVTYILENEEKTIAFFSLSNDRISVEDFDNDPKLFKKTIKRRFPFRKQFKSYPAVKIGRLAVDNEFKKAGLGTTILDFIKIFFLAKNKTGCRYITVDAYNGSLGFYEKNGFQFLSVKDEGKDTRLMYYDLLPLAISLKENKN